eukprot:9037779-Pyramimonas_sp.AAC.2
MRDRESGGAEFPSGRLGDEAIGAVQRNDGPNCIDGSSAQKGASERPMVDVATHCGTWKKVSHRCPEGGQGG